MTGHESTATGSVVPASADARGLVLVVEDELFIRMFISDALRDAGYVVVEAFSADEAVDIMGAGKPIDLVLTDVRMPGAIDGIGLLRFIRKRFLDLPVILASGHLDPSVASAEGADHLFAKPYDVAAVLEMVSSKLVR